MEQRPRPSLATTLKSNWKLSIYAVVLMTAFNFFSHGTQDLYPTFLREQHHFDPHTVPLITIVLNIGAIVGGLTFGTISEKIGRRRATFPGFVYQLGNLLASGNATMQASVAVSRGND
jgi:SHS family lactate transporter-like MFS transporter